MTMQNDKRATILENRSRGFRAGGIGIKDGLLKVLAGNNEKLFLLID